MANPRIAVVGACASGKSTLVSSLRRAGYEARHVVQEHSHVPEMWRKVAQPDLLIYLDVDYESAMARRPSLMFRPRDLAEQLDRLLHARRHCDLYLNTTSLTASEVRAQALTYLSEITRIESSSR